MAALFDALASLPPPGEQLLRRQPVPARHVRHDHARRECLLNDTGLIILCKPAPSAGPSDHLQPANSRHLRLKRMVKRRHKPIPDSEIVILADHQCQGKAGSQRRFRLLSKASKIRIGRLKRRVSKRSFELILNCNRMRLAPAPDAWVNFACLSRLLAYRRQNCCYFWKQRLRYVTFFGQHHQAKRSTTFERYTLFGIYERAKSCAVPRTNSERDGA